MSPIAAIIDDEEVQVFDKVMIASNLRVTETGVRKRTAFIRPGSQGQVSYITSSLAETVERETSIDIDDLDRVEVVDVDEVEVL